MTSFSNPLLALEVTPFSQASYNFSDAITGWYLESESNCEKAVKWIPCMLGYLTQSIYSALTLILDVALGIITGVGMLITGFQFQSLNDFNSVCWSSAYFDSQALSIGLVGIFAPSSAKDLRLQYLAKNFVNLSCSLIRNFFDESTADRALQSYWQRIPSRLREELMEREVQRQLEDLDMDQAMGQIRDNVNQIASNVWTGMKAMWRNAFSS